MPKKAIISGCSGQDGSYLSELLLAKDYEVHGIVRRCSCPRLDRIQHLLGHPNFHLHSADVTDLASLVRIFQAISPDEIYNLAAQSFVSASWTEPLATSDITAVGVLRMLEAMRQICPQARFYQASSSEMFGKVRATPQDESTPFHPRSPYGVSKAFGHYMTVNYRESYGMFAASGILFNHESPRRGLEFVTRKITHGLAKIKLGLLDKLTLGNLAAKRDWGFAGDYVEAMWLMLQANDPDDFVVATGETRSVEELLLTTLEVAGLTGQPTEYVTVSADLMRPAEVDLLQGNPTKAKTVLGWTPATSFRELVEKMYRADYDSLKSTLRT